MERIVAVKVRNCEGKPNFTKTLEKMQRSISARKGVISLPLNTDYIPSKLFTEYALLTTMTPFHCTHMICVGRFLYTKHLHVWSVTCSCRFVLDLFLHKTFMHGWHSGVVLCRTFFYTWIYGTCICNNLAYCWLRRVHGFNSGLPCTA